MVGKERDVHIVRGIGVERARVPDCVDGRPDKAAAPEVDRGEDTDGGAVIKGAERGVGDVGVAAPVDVEGAAGGRGKGGKGGGTV